MAFATKEQPTTIGRATCKHCGRYDHDEASCYETIGYPQSWSSRGREDMQEEETMEVETTRIEAEASDVKQQTHNKPSPRTQYCPVTL